MWTVLGAVLVALPLKSCGLGVGLSGHSLYALPAQSQSKVLALAGHMVAHP